MINSRRDHRKITMPHHRKARRVAATKAPEYRLS